MELSCLVGDILNMQLFADLILQNESAQEK